MQMKPHFLRYFGSEIYLIPEEVVDLFDKLCRDIHNTKDSAELYELHDTFANNYGDFKCEGELHKIRLFIEQPVRINFFTDDGRLLLQTIQRPLIF